jgi:hypothetical protein
MRKKKAEADTRRLMMKGRRLIGAITMISAFTFATMSKLPTRRESFLKAPDPMSITPEIFVMQDNHWRD